MDTHPTPYTQMKRASGMTDYLRCCPFCGTAYPDLGVLSICDGLYAVSCERCGAIGPNAFSSAEASSLWNTVEGRMPGPHE